MNTMIFIMAALGILAHLLAKWIDAMTTSEPMNWKKHGLFSIYSAVILTALILAGDTAGILPELNNITAFIAGYFADSLFKNLTLFNPWKTTER